MNKIEKKNTLAISAGKVISRFGNIVFDYSNVTYIASKSNGSLAFVGIYQASESIISIIFNLFGGVIADRFNRKKIIIITDFLSGILCLLLSFFVSQAKYLLYLIVLANVVLAVLDCLSGPSYKSIVKEVIEKDNIQKFNSVLETSSRITQVLGPLIAVFIYKQAVMRGALLVDGASFILSGLITMAVIPIVEVTLAEKKKFSLFNLVSDIKEGFIYVYSRKKIFYLIALSSLCNFLFAGYNLIIPFTNKMFSASNVNVYGTILTAEAVGGIAGALLSSFFNKKLSEKKIIAFITANGLLLALLGIVFKYFQSIPVIFIIVAIFSFCLSNFNIQFFSKIQSEVDTEYLGRVFSIIFTVAVLFMPIGSLVFSAFLKANNPNNFIFLGIVMIIISIIFIFLIDRLSSEE
ncbi:MFS transporter [Floricoccus penangensis]|uniref:MFS transporter n=1 Tax=Floricoccus penangensis TaxID=1859475 RepID=UPI00203F4E1C|nr:MFS transporter [Floricoccus penangensis]URZ87106.1 MFS transporter [Floricoccus penangensis]